LLFVRLESVLKNVKIRVEEDVLRDMRNLALLRKTSISAVAREIIKGERTGKRRFHFTRDESARASGDEEQTSGRKRAGVNRRSSAFICG
jgi:hypothetical protein